MTNRTYYDSYEYFKGLVSQTEESLIEKISIEVDVSEDTFYINKVNNVQHPEVNCLSRGGGNSESP